jgi:uncharacterized protein (TIGR02145 family)
MGTATANTETGLTCNTAYTRYIWAYNSCGNSMSVILNATTTACPSFICGQLLTDNRDGKTYSTVQIGTQCWFKENLNIGTFINGASSPQNNGIIEKYCPSDLESNCSIYGGLYKWMEMMQYASTEGGQGICPSGWHIPTDGEWCTVTQFIDPTVNCGVYGWRGTNAGGKMKTTGTIEAGTGLWYAPNTGATNESGFSSVPAGMRIYTGVYGTLCCYGQQGKWWSSTSYASNTYAFYQYLEHDNNKIKCGWEDQQFGFSVRCLRDF